MIAKKLKAFGKWFDYHVSYLNVATLNMVASILGGIVYLVTYNRFALLMTICNILCAIFTLYQWYKKER